ncbi:carboxypeptidase-like regulatory domain-containing protein [Ichthyobacterium seriolicida]|uniref:TonB-dependent receptor n=1 Tax=Ichthyobacterium seriolicida TaxID=242600 RepID=A0A1J1DZX3_9FLAO|nr:carboxypeptidase-like regulatory domain-containing protein [Ichthyobacterium seriolicida]BAV94229.1 hypothetical protein JBKA6_0216 [Ichthyobacterium seriolicida]
MIKSSFKKAFVSTVLGLVSIVLFSSSAYSQNSKSVSGVVTDDSGESILGVSVYIEGTEMGTTTDLDGMFYLKDLPDEKTVLIFSHEEYTAVSKELDMDKNLDSLKIILNKVIELNEMVLTGDRVKSRTSY